MKNALFIISLLLVSTTGFTQSLLNSLSDGDLDVLRDFERFDPINQAREKRYYIKDKKNKYTTAKYEIQAINLKQIAKSKTFLAFIKRGVKLVNIYTGDIKYLPKDLTARLHTLTDNDGFKYLKNRNGTLSFKVLSNKVVKIKDIATLYIPPKEFKPVVNKIDLKYDDDNLLLETNYKTSLGLSSSRFAQNLTKKNQTSAINAKFSIETLVDMTIPYQAGISFSIENMYGSSSSNKYQFRTIQLGPIFKTKRNKNGYSYYLNANTSVFSEFINTEGQSEAKYKITDRNLNIGFEKIYKTHFFGKVLLGLNYQRKWIIGTKQNSFLELNNFSEIEDSITLHFGIQTNWQL